MNESQLDHFNDLSGWLPVASGEAVLKINPERSADRSAMRLDFDFKGSGGFVVARKLIQRKMPGAYLIRFRVRGAAPANKLEFKLIDPTNANVWRWQREAFAFSAEWQELQVKSREVEFAWGPAGGGGMTELGAIEFALVAGPGGAGTIWIDDLRIEDRSLPMQPRISASSIREGCKPSSLLDDSEETSWQPLESDRVPWLMLDFFSEREYGGLIVDWLPSLQDTTLEAQASQDGIAWNRLQTMHGDHANRSYLHLPGGESRFLRLHFPHGLRGGIQNIRTQPFDFSRSPAEFFHSIARQESRGLHPRWLHREQSYWTSAGVAHGTTCALMNEEGMVEVDKGTFSLEPFVSSEGKLFTWADVKCSQSLEQSELPIPSAHWHADEFTLQTTAFATGSGDAAVLLVRYRLSNTSSVSRQYLLTIAMRPFQVNPPWQAWNGLGGVGEIRELSWDGVAVWVNRNKAVIPLTKPLAFGASAFGAIDIGVMPEESNAKDALGFASGAFQFEMHLDSLATEDVYVAVPFGFSDAVDTALIRQLDGAEQLSQATGQWKSLLSNVSVRGSGLAQEGLHVFKSAAAHILIHRNGPALQPGPRRYTRSWIRDGVIMGAALLRAGHPDALRDFIRWYAPYQREDGFVPCCVDHDGPDWLVEHDSHGQLIYAVMEHFRFAADRTFLEEMWPAARKAGFFIESLRQQRMTPEYEMPDKRACYGLLPESASHEGYLAHPVHAYWDDFWALRGLRDLAAMASLLGHEEDAVKFKQLSAAFQETLGSSIRMVIENRGLDYIPGSVEWADFDPTATANAISLLDGADFLPETVMQQTFARYVVDFRKKRSGEMPWTNYSAYEIRIVGTLARLGRREEALELMEFFLSDRRPLKWNQWPEISWHDPRSPGHLGDVPHTWIAAEYMLAYAMLFEVIPSSRLESESGNDPIHKAL